MGKLGNFRQIRFINSFILLGSIIKYFTIVMRGGVVMKMAMTGQIERENKMGKRRWRWVRGINSI